MRAGIFRPHRVFILTPEGIFNIDEAFSYWVHAKRAEQK